MKNIFKNALLSAVVFGMAIASGFAMDSNPPSEPVKKVVETEVEPETLQMGFGYMDSSGNCVQYTGELPSDCTIEELSVECTVTVGGIPRHLYFAVKNPITNVWSCITPLYKQTP